MLINLVYQKKKNKSLAKYLNNFTILKIVVSKTFTKENYLVIPKEEIIEKNIRLKYIKHENKI